MGGFQSKSSASRPKAREEKMAFEHFNKACASDTRLLPPCMGAGSPECMGGGIEN